MLGSISFETISNEFIAILGPSGSGKSTLLRIIAGLESPDSGHIYHDNIEITHFPPKDRKIGMVFQNFSVYHHLTVFDNLALPLKIQGQDKNKTKASVERIATQLHIDHLLRRKSDKLSGGEMQRVAIAKNLLRDANIILLDEPLNNLDSTNKEVIKNLIKEISQSKSKIFIYVTHDYKEAMVLSDRTAILNEGEIVQLDKPETIYNNPENLFVAEFIGEPRINVLKTKLVNMNYHYFADTQIGKIPIEKEFFDKNINCNYIGIRPEDIIIDKNGPITVSVKSLEYMGSFNIISINEADNFKIISNIDNISDVNGGGQEKIKLNFKKNKVKFF